MIAIAVVFIALALVLGACVMSGLRNRDVNNNRPRDAKAVAKTRREILAKLEARLR